MNVQGLFDLNGRTALVTGGSRGLGLQIAEALGEAGARSYGAPYGTGESLLWRKSWRG